jgi:hypothetical protein
MNRLARQKTLIEVEECLGPIRLEEARSSRFGIQAKKGRTRVSPVQKVLNSVLMRGREGLNGRCSAANP